MTQQERQARSRELICQAALEEFGTHGYDAVNMERICAGHGISKGMMYHYYSNKDELFLACVEHTFSELKARIEQDIKDLPQGDVLNAIKDYFLIREYYFELHPLEKGIFETAMLHTPETLRAQITVLRTPLRKLNHSFLVEQFSRVTLREGLDRKKVIRYLESMEPLFGRLLRAYRAEGESLDLHSMLTCAEELLEFLLLGILQPGAAQGPTEL